MVAKKAAVMEKEERKQEEVPKKALQTKGASDAEMEHMLEEAEEEAETLEGDAPEKESSMIQASKPIAQVKKGDTLIIDGKAYTVDAHTVLVDHGIMKEMAIELFDKSDKDYQLRYFDDQVESTLELYELQEIMYVKKPVKSVSW